LRILVLLKVVPSNVASPRLSKGGDRIVGKIGPLVMNESDEYALEHAAALAETLGGEVTILSAGGKSSEKVLAKGLAKGAVRAVRVGANPPDPEVTAALLAAAAKKLGYDLILSGVESSDVMASRVGIATAEKLGIPFVYSVREIKPGESEGTLLVSKELGGGVTQMVEIKLPALVCVQACSIPLSLVSVTRLLKARNQPVEVFTADELGLAEVRGAHLKLLDVFHPEKNRARTISGTPAEVSGKVISLIEEAF
jgi:electron transfer flavoprotein beta subunit